MYFYLLMNIYKTLYVKMLNVFQRDYKVYIYALQINIKVYMNIILETLVYFYKVLISN